MKTQLAVTTSNPDSGATGKMAGVLADRQPLNEVGFIDRAELARRLKVSIGSVHNYCRQGKISYIKLGRRVVFDWETTRQQLLRQQRGGIQ